MYMHKNHMSLHFIVNHPLYPVKRFFITEHPVRLTFPRNTDIIKQHTDRKEEGVFAMDQQVIASVASSVAASVRAFRLPLYHEIPGVGLYLEQVTKYINDCLSPLMQAELTASMISNYVKKGMIANPVRKQYSREQIAYLMFIAMVKSVLSMEDIRLMVSIQQKTYTAEKAYNYFCKELENVLEYVFERKSELKDAGSENTNEKIMLRNTIITVAHKVYLDKLFAALRTQEEKNA